MNSSSEGIFSLDDLISESKQFTKAKSNIKKIEVTIKKQLKQLPHISAILDAAWEIQHQTVQIINQRCQCCNSSVKYVGAISAHAKHKRMPAWREITQPFDSNLAVMTRMHEMTVPQCFGCLRTAQIVDGFLSAVNTTQMELF